MQRGENNMKQKKIISVIAAAVLAFGITAGAAETMTIDQATQYALENSPTYKSAIAAAKMNEYSARESAKTYKNYHDSDSYLSQMSISSFDMYLVRMGYVKNASDLQLRVAERECERQNANIKMTVRKDFYTYLSSKEKVVIAQNSLASAKERLSEADEKKKLGTISDIEYKTFENAVLTAENALEQAKRTSESSMRALKNVLGYDLDKELEVSGKFERNTEKPLTPAEVIAKLDTSADIMTMNENMALAEERAKLAERWYFSSENGYWTEKYTLEKAQHDYKNNTEAIKLGVYNLYDSLLMLDENINMTGKSIELLKTTLDASKLQYDLGMITAQDYVEKEQQYVDAQNKLVDLQLTECISKLQYKLLYTYDLGI